MLREAMYRIPTERHLIADAHPLFADALRQTLAPLRPQADWLSCACFVTVLDALPEPGTVCHVYLGEGLPGLSARSSVAQLHQRCPSVRVAWLGNRSCPPAWAARQADVFWSKTLPPAALVRAAQAWWPALPAMGAHHDDLPQLLARLTRQERCVLRYLQRGVSNKVVAIDLAISESTVKAHVSSILRKLQVRNRTSAVLKMNPLSVDCFT